MRLVSTQVLDVQTGELHIEHRVEQQSVEHRGHREQQRRLDDQVKLFERMFKMVHKLEMDWWEGARS